MKAVVISAAPAQDQPMGALMSALRAELAQAGYDEIEHFELAEQRIGFCQGEFDCWLKHPGRCKINDGMQAVAAAVPTADALVYVGRVAFGGFEQRLKLAIDRLICLVLPFFEARSVLTHHEVRYARRPRLHSVGLLRTPDAAQTDTFDALNDANAINFRAPGRSSVVLDEQHPGAWTQRLRRLLASPWLEPGSAITGRDALRQELLAAARPPLLPAFAPVRKAALLVGSPKPEGTSASELIARAFESELRAEGVDVVLHRARDFVHEDSSSLAAAKELAGADLLMLCTPLYVDSLPALVVSALQQITRVRDTGREALFVPIVQCGFPEPEHVRTALRMTRHFAQAAGYHFAGALPLGGGGVVTPERSLAEGHGPVQHIAAAVKLAAPALAAGESVPESALREMLKQPLPNAVYRFMGHLGFRLEAYRRGTPQRELRHAPYAG